MVSQPDTPQRIAQLTPLGEVLFRLDALVKPVPPRQVEIAAAGGRILAGNPGAVLSPLRSLALLDGWAVSSDLTTDASSYAPAPLPTATRIDVGEPIPPGADAVAPFDAVEMREGRVEITMPVAVGEGVLATGADADRRSTLARDGRPLTHIQAAVLSAVGVENLQIREPRVRLVRSRAVGDAVIDAAMALLAGEIVAAGGQVLRAGEGSHARLEDAFSDDTADAVVAIGGTGSGRNDAGVVTLARVGRVEVHGIALAPGETAAFGMVGPRPVLLLPGRLDAALAVWLVIGRRLMARLCGSTEEEPATKAKLARKVASALGLAEVVPVRLRDGAAEPIASGYVPFAALAQAEGWILVPADSEGYPQGAEVVIRPWP
jgi:molybdopterin molybdotransferase